MRDEAFDKRCAELYAKHRLSARQIAQRMGVTQSRVYCALDRQGVQRRTISQAMRAANAHHGEVP